MDLSTLRYTKTHEWASRAGDICTIGITKFAADQLQDITYIKLPTVGAQVTAEGSIGEVETVKAVSDLYAPVSGEVVEVNTKVGDNPELMKSDPFGAGWVAKIRLAPGATLDHLMDAAAYENQINSEPH
jgi:glycine cleavage system H protein